MTQPLGSPLPAVPVLRPLDIRWVERDGTMYLSLADPLGLSGGMLLVPGPLAPLLGLMDGSRGLSDIQRDFQQWTNLAISHEQVAELVAALDDALFLDSPRYQQALDGLLIAYRSAPFREPSHADQVYPASVAELQEQFRGFGGPPAGGIPDLSPVTGLISPHIDYYRGGRTYAQVWGRATAAVRAADLVVIFGTDHAGTPGLTLTSQSYATPYGVLPTPRDLVDRLARAIGPERAFAAELNHRNEHSVELAAVWLHHTRQGQPVEMLPILCGSFDPYVRGLLDPESDETFGRVLDILRAESLRRRVLVVAAGDLAHVGTTFGDEEPITQLGRQALAEADRALLAACAQGDHRAFLRAVQAVEDRYRICGLPPIYFALRMLGASRGEVLGYDQCPADPDGGSVVSIAGVVLRQMS